MKDRKLLVSIDGKTEGMLEEIRNRVGTGSLSAAIRFSIFEAHRSLFPAYLQKSAPGLTKEEKELQEKGEKEKRMLDICDALGGHVEVVGSQKTCVFYTYNYTKRFEQRATLSALFPEMLQSQYTPSKEKVMKLKEEGKTEW